MFMMLQNRSIPLVIIFGLITCGIYPLYWLYQTAKTEKKGWFSLRVLGRALDALL